MSVPDQNNLVLTARFINKVWRVASAFTDHHLIWYILHVLNASLNQIVSVKVCRQFHAASHVPRVAPDAYTVSD